MTQPPPPWSGKDSLFASLLAFVTFAAYLPAWQGGPLWDDPAHLTQPALRSAHGLARIWFEVGATQQYYPLTHTVFWIEQRLWGDATLGYHLLNLALHVTVALLAWRLLVRLGVPGARLAAAVFALHPVQVESVAWMAELKNTLSGVFCLAAALLHLRFDRTRRPRDYALALGVFLLGLMSKTVIATLPPALLVILWWKRGRLSWRRDVLPLAGWMAVGIPAGLFTAWIERNFIGAVGAEYHLSLVQRILIAGRALSFYLGKLLWPAKLIFIYPRWDVSPSAAWQYLYPAGAALVLAALWMLRSRWRGPLAAALVYAIMLAPVLGFVNVFPFRYSFVADHFQYLASLSIFALLAAGVALLLRRLGPGARGAAEGACLLLLAGLALATLSRNGNFSDGVTLYTSVIDDNPTCWLAYNNRGTALGSEGKFDEAIADLNRAIALKPDHAEAYANRGAAYNGLKRYDKAIEDLTRSIQLRPGYAEVHLNRSNSYKAIGRYDRALADLNEALRLKPDFVEGYNNRAATYLQLQDYDRAWADVQTCRRLGGTPMPALVEKLRVMSGRDQ